MERDRILEDVRAEDGEDVTLLEAAPPEGRRDALDAVGELAVGELPAADTIDQGGFVAELAGPLQHELAKRDVRDFECRTFRDDGRSLLTRSGSAAARR